MGVSGWITQVIVAYIGLSMMGMFGEVSKDLMIAYGIVLLVLVIWYAGRRFGIVPSF